MTFYGDEKSIKNVANLFRKMIEEMKRTRLMVKPDFIEEPDGYMDEVFFESNHLDLNGEQSSINVMYSTRWAPNRPDIIAINDRFGTKCKYEYEELGSFVFGVMFYDSQTKEKKQYDLEHADFDKFELNEQTDKYEFRGQEWDCEYEILETLLEEKYK